MKRNIDLAKIDGKEWALCVSKKTITIDFNGCSINFTPPDESPCYVLITDLGAHLTLIDSSESENGGIYATQMNGNLIRNKDECSIVIESGTYSANAITDENNGMIDTRCATIIDDNGKISSGVWIKGGKFTLGNVDTMVNGAPWIFNASGQNVREIIISGGTFNANVQNQYYPFEAEIPKEYALKDNGNNTYTIVKAVCYVNVNHYSGGWWTYQYGCESFEEALQKVDWNNHKKEEKVNGVTKYINGWGDTITFLDDCCVNDLLPLPEDKNFYLESEEKLYVLDGSTNLPAYIHFTSQNFHLHTSSSLFHCKGGYCIDCSQWLDPTVDHTIDSTKECMDQECEECGSLVIGSGNHTITHPMKKCINQTCTKCQSLVQASVSHNYEIIDNHKVCSMCGHTVPLTMSGGTEGIISPENKTTQNSNDQLEVSDIVTGTMVVIAVAILGMIIFDVVRKP